ncbi:glycoside hydrolase [Halegenticoccus tardaugens]|uniref:glycoside hydrolase n=1 Tax=Halegenticoccus tardaugens TaxID=2071624 RepID=UPI00100B40D7|nr:glycoside hydrolase [Halegenticoccus tardaugens]
MSSQSSPSIRSLAGIRGAVYVPARAFNAHQAWREYEPLSVERDLGYAARLNLNAIRFFVSYEYWLDEPGGLERALDHFLDSAAVEGLRALPILFESAGREPTREHLRDRDPETACAVCSPAADVIRNERRWSERRPRGLFGTARRALRLDRGDRRTTGGPREYVEWFAERYGDDDRLLAIEIMNEPGGWAERLRFARRMLRVADDGRGDVPLTMGCKDLETNLAFEEPRLDAFQFHHNLPPTRERARDAFADARRFGDEHGRPVWLTEWQRTRDEPPDVTHPHYASLADVVRESDLDGDFFWSLMLKPAYLPKQRENGRLNGVFHEDGPVWSAADARAIAGDPDLPIRERRDPPSWLPGGVTRAE